MIHTGFEPISYADLEVLAAKVAATKSWAAIKIKQSSLPSGGEVISSAFGAAFNVRLGRRDATEPDPAGRLPLSDAPVEEIVVCRLQQVNAMAYLRPRVPCTILISS